MKEQLVTFDEAVALRELGFDEPCFGFKIKNQIKSSIQVGITNSKLKKKAEKFRRTYKGILNEEVACPTYGQAFDWFIEVWDINPILFSDGFIWTFDLRWKDKTELLAYPFVQFPKLESSRIICGTHKKAKQACLEKLIEICKTEKK